MKDRGPSLQSLRAKVRASGLRATGPRLAVLRCLIEAQTPLSHAEITGRLEPGGFDRTTVFRNLSDLVDAGLLVRMDLGDHIWRFEVRGPVAGRGAHPHLYCLDCGAVSCLEQVTVTITGLRPRVETGIEQVLLKGHCARCA